MRLREMKNVTEKLLIRQFESRIFNALDCIERIDEGNRRLKFRIETGIHKMVLTGDYVYNEIENVLGALKLRSAADNWRKDQYRRMCIRNEKNFILNIFLDPIQGPRCLLEITPRGEMEFSTYKTSLMDLDRLLPDLKVTSAEYFTDVYCYDYDAYLNPIRSQEAANAKAVENLFLVFTECLYVPNRRRPPDKYLDSLGEANRRTIFHRAGKTKFYERGPDSKKLPDYGWRHEDTDRVRLEHEANRRNLRNVQIKSLSDFIANPHFSAINEPLYSFRHFLKKEMPKPWFRRIFFMEEHIKRRRKENVYYSKEVDELALLLSQLRETWSIADEKWQAAI